MTKIYRLDLEGKELTRWKIEKLVPNAAMSGDCRIDVAPDRKRLLLSLEMGEEHHRKDWDGPQPALWILDLETQKVTRLTAANLFAWEGCWISNDSVAFLNQPIGSKRPSIYTMSTSDKKMKLLVKDAEMPSVNAR